MRRLPIRWRLTLAFTLVMAIVLAITGAFVQARLAVNLDSSTADALRARAADVAALAQQSDTGLAEARVPQSGIRGVEFAQVIDPAGHVIDRTPRLSSLPLLTPAQLRRAQEGRRVARDVVLGDEPVRILAVAVPAQGRRLVVVVGQSREPRNRAIHDLRSILLLGGPAALLLAAVAGYVLTGAALRPVDRMRRKAATITAQRLDGRLPPAGGDDELGRLGRTLNDMLGRIQAAVARERTFVSDASHELRSPLAMLRTELELLARDRPTGPAFDAAVTSAIEETTRLTELTEDLLTLARADDHSMHVRLKPTAAQDMLHAAASRARRRWPQRALRIDVTASPDVAVPADEERLARALDNLLDNAMRHAGSRVRLCARAAGPNIELHVLDDGPGFPETFLPAAWDRFARGDAGHTESGTGLGLSIVKATAELHGGTAHAANRDGGADVWITLPAQRRMPVCPIE